MERTGNKEKTVGIFNVLLFNLWSHSVWRLWLYFYHFVAYFFWLRFLVINFIWLSLVTILVNVSILLWKYVYLWSYLLYSSSSLILNLISKIGLSKSSGLYMCPPIKGLHWLPNDHFLYGSITYLRSYIAQTLCM